MIHAIPSCFMLRATRALLTILLIVLLLPVVSADLLLPAAAVEAAAEGPQNRLEAPSTPIHATLTIDRLPLKGEAATLSCEVSSVRDAPGTRVQIELPANARLVDGATTWEGSLATDAPLRLVARVVFEAAGDTAIFCRALRPIDELNVWGDLDALYLNIGETVTHEGFAPVPRAAHDAVGDVEQAGEGTLVSALAAYPAAVGGGEPGAVDAQAPGTQRGPATVPEVPQGNLTITGRWRFSGRDGTTQSEQMRVEIVRGDNSNHLAWCYTAIDGYYTCGPFTNPGSAGVRSRFLSYTNFNPYSDVLVTVNPDSGTTGNTDNAFAFTTPVYSYSDGTHDIGAWLVPSSNDNKRAYWVTDDLIGEWKYIYFQTGSSQSPQETSGPSTVQWKIDSTDGTYYSRGGNIHLEGPDPLSDTVVGHEYGHNMMWTIYGDWMPTTYCPSPHYIQYYSHPNCAWTEGWANFITIATNNDPVYRWASGSSLNLENPTWTTANWDDGDGVEGRVAGGMWDILDTNNEGDDQYSEGDLVDIWDTIYHQNDNRYSEYWSAWLSRGHNNTSAGPIMSNYQSTIDYRSGPGNDDFADANIISGSASGYSHLNLDTTGATTQGNDPVTQCGSTVNNRQSRSVWYRFSPTTTNNFTFDTEGADYDTVLAIWTGSFSSLTHRGCDDDSGSGLLSQLSRRLYSGTTYYIEVMRYSSGSGGTLDFHMSRQSGASCYDFNGNGRVDMADIQDVAGRFGNTSAGNLYHDVILDGVINVTDLVEIGGDWNVLCTLDAGQPYGQPASSVEKTAY